MLTRIEIDGFKSFEEFSVDLAPFVVILGTNASGKSNLFDAVQLLAGLAGNGVSDAIKGLRGEPLELFRRTPSGYAKTIRLAVEVLLDPTVRDPWGSEVTLGHTRIRYEIVLEWREIRPGIDRVMVARESAVPMMRKQDGWAKAMRPTREFRDAYLRYNRQKELLSTEGEAAAVAFRIHQDGKQGRTRPASAAEASVLSSITNAEFAHLFALREEMRSWRLLQLDPALLRQPASATAADLLQPDGANLAAVLARIKLDTATAERPAGVLADIAAELNALIPGVKSLDAALDMQTREYRAQLTMRDGVPYSSRVVSDGTLRVLALLTLLHDPRHRGLVCFEEPENGVHPARLKQLVHSLQRMVTHPSDASLAPGSPLSQLLLNSHSPVVLRALIGEDLHTQDDHVLFADTVSVADPSSNEVRRRTRLRPVLPSVQTDWVASSGGETANVSKFEVQQILETATADA